MTSFAWPEAYLRAVSRRRELERIAIEHNGPIYVTYLDALGHYGLVTDVPDGLQCATLADSCVMETPAGTMERYALPEDLFFGYSEAGGTPLADPEKAVVDGIWIDEQEGRVPYWLENLDLAGLDRDRLLSYAETMGITDIEQYLGLSRIS